MRICVPREIKGHEYRVGLTPDCVATYCSHGHRVSVETGAGDGAGYNDEDYTRAGATMVSDIVQAIADSELVIKVKEPLPEEYRWLRPGLIVFAYLHLAAEPHLAHALLSKGVTAIAYETITDSSGGLPCLKPMSEIAGRLSIQEGAKYLERPYGGRGILLGGIPGIKRGQVVILGAGVVGTNAAKIAVGIGAEVTILDVSVQRLAYLDDIFGSRITTLTSDPHTVRQAISEADVVIGAVLIPGRAAPKLVNRSDLAIMRPGAVIVDVAIDQGGCIETSVPTSHDHPVRIVDGIVHYGVTNMPGVVARSSTIALTSRTRRYGLAIADHGWRKALDAIPDLVQGLNCAEGQCTNSAIADSLQLPLHAWSASANESLI